MAEGGGLYCERRWGCIKRYGSMAEAKGIEDSNRHETKALSFQKT